VRLILMLDFSVLAFYWWGYHSASAG